VSRFENTSKKNLKMILSLMDESIERNGNPRSIVDYRNGRAITTALETIGIEINNQDLNFLVQLHKQNPNYQTEEIKIPTLKVFEVTTRRQAVMYVVEYWVNTVSSYVDEDDLSSYLTDMDDLDWWEGQKVDEDITSEETTDTEIDDINRIK
jgi:hypothetical protein